MRRNLLMPIAGGVAAALILVGVLFLVGHHHTTTDVAISSSTPSALPTFLPTLSPSVTTAPVATGSHTPRGDAKPTPTPHPTRTVSSVDCTKPSDAQFCSRKGDTVFTNGTFTPPKNAGPVSHPNAATITMDSTLGSSKIHAVVTIENKSSRTFHFPSREIDFEITRDGKHFDTITTSGAAFDMTPGTKMTGTFDRPISENGTYAWQARVWYWVE